MKRILFSKRALALFLACLSLLLTACSGGSGEVVTTEVTTEEETQQPTVEEDPRLLYNGIYLPEVWPPEDVSKNFNEVIEAPYLSEISEGGMHPDVVNIDVGRQLFVDDFLIDSTTLKTVFHKPTTYENNPVFKTDLAYGFHFKHGGMWYNEKKGIIEMWYNLGNGVGYAYSSDGINWTDEGAVFTFSDKKGGYATVIKDTNAGPDDPQFYMLVRRSNGYHDPNSEEKDHEHYPTLIYYSFTGKKWMPVGSAATSGDASSLIYNPFRDVWQLSLRRSYKTKPYVLGRCRDYLELPNLLNLENATDENVVFWLRADKDDIWHEKLNFQPEVYSMCAVGYESIMLGAFQMLQGPENQEMAATGIPKITNIVLGYSRDGFYYTRPDRTSFLESSEIPDAWDRGYLHEVGSVCLIVGDELWFYYTGYKGDQTQAGTSSTGGALHYCSVGLAKLRRDGFASLSGTGSVTTRKMTVTQGQKYLFVNAKATSLKAELLDADGNVMEGYSMADCTPFSGDSTCAMLKWGEKDLSHLSGTEFSIRFEMTDGDFYAFWLSAIEAGDSNGQTAGGVVKLS